ncbi:hypothetical protein TNCV_4429471 [Trichonephila clavipes]|nr:hypothetical protein TNCV_4429471 [Trichonephila clavipes]
MGSAFVCVIVANATCLTVLDRSPEIHRGNGLEVRLSLALALSTIQVTVRLSSVKFPLVRQVGIYYDTWRHNRFPSPQFRHGTGGEKNLL